MWTRIIQLFRASKVPRRSYIHPALGTFEFHVGVGWKRYCRVDGHDVEVAIGSDGEMPSADMASTVTDWALHWADLRQAVVEYIDRELSTWNQEWHPTVANRLVLSSIQVPWPDSPTTTMLYFDDPDDDSRSWHVTYEGGEPKGFAFDE